MFASPTLRLFRLVKRASGEMSVMLFWPIDSLSRLVRPESGDTSVILFPHIV